MRLFNIVLYRDIVVPKHAFIKNVFRYFKNYICLHKNNRNIRINSENAFDLLVIYWFET